MKKRTFTALLALLLAACLLLAGCQKPAFLEDFDLPFFQEEEPEARTDGRRTIPFNKMKYERPDVDAMLAKMTELTEGIQNAASFEELWALDEEAGDLAEHFYTMSTLAEIKKYQDTTNSSYQEEYRYCSEHGVSLSNAMNDLNQVIVDGPYADAYRQEVGDVVYQSILDALRLNSAEVEDLKKQRNQLGADYNEDLTTLTVPYEGKEYTLADLKQLETMLAYGLELAFYEIHSSHFVNLYSQMIELDREIAGKLGFASVPEMYYLGYSRDYTPEDALAFCESSKETIVPLIASAPWGGGGPYDIDLDVCFDKMPGYLEEVDPELATSWQDMIDYGVSDYEPGAKKQTGIAFTTNLSEYDIPFCYGYWENDLRSATTVMHEFGHFYDKWLRWDTDVVQSLDIAESYSQGLELLLQKDFADLTGDAEGAVQSHLGDFVQSLTYQAMLEEFQQEVYKMETLDAEGITKLYTEMLDDYGYGDFGAGETLDYSWIGITHLFDVPFYTISYSTSATVALQIWSQSLDDWQTGADTYMALIKADQNQPFTQLVESVGLKAPQDEEVLPAIAADLMAVYGLAPANIPDDGSVTGEAA